MGPILETRETDGLHERMMAYQEDVFRVCLGFARNPWDAEDLSQEVYLKAFRTAAKIHDPGALRTWLLRIARNTCLDHQKKSRFFRLFLRSVNPSDIRAAPDPHDRVQTNERLARLKEAVRRLPVKQREVFVLREYGHLSYAELAKTLDIREGTVMSRLNRGRKAVEDFMRGASDEKRE